MKKGVEHMMIRVAMIGRREMKKGVATLIIMCSSIAAAAACIMMVTTALAARAGTITSREGTTRVYVEQPTRGPSRDQAVNGAPTTTRRPLKAAAKPLTVKLAQVPHSTHANSATVAQALSSTSAGKYPAQDKKLSAAPVVKGGGTYKLDCPHGGLSDSGCITKEQLSWAQVGQDRYLCRRATPQSQKCWLKMLVYLSLKSHKYPFDEDGEYVVLRYIDRLFGLARGLHFVEIGGFDGEKYSNTLFLERERGWNGLLVEANPYTFQQMKRKDRACYMAHACVSSQAESMHFKIAGSITTAAEIITRQHATRLNNDVKVYGHLKQWEGSGSTEPVKCYRLEELMLGAVNLGQHIDFFSLDVEGAEMHILESISWDEVSIDAFMVEEEEGKTSHEAVNTLLQSKGFRQVAKLRWDTIYVANDIECTPQNATHEQVVCKTRKP